MSDIRHTSVPDGVGILPSPIALVTPSDFSAIATRSRACFPSLAGSTGMPATRIPLPPEPGSRIPAQARIAVALRVSASLPEAMTIRFHFWRFADPFPIRSGGTLRLVNQMGVNSCSNSDILPVGCDLLCESNPAAKKQALSRSRCPGPTQAA
jgi:hypothetical protein